jgi:C-terminal processing protease CtpA/Prc
MTHPAAIQRRTKEITTRRVRITAKENQETMSHTWTGTVTKVTRDAKVGISFRGQGTESSPVLIAAVRGLFASNTNLVPGLHVESINAVNVEGMSSESVARLVIDAEAGEVTIVASGVLFACKKRRKEDPVGFSLQKNSALDAILIVRIARDGYLANSGLQVGQKVTFVNGVRCPTSTMDVIALLQKHKEVYIVAVDLSEAARTRSRQTASQADEMVLASVENSSCGRLGIAFRKCPQTDVIFITNVSENGLFAESELKAGQRLVSINGTPCPDSTVAAIRLILQVKGTLTLAAYATDIPITQASNAKEEEEIQYDDVMSTDYDDNEQMIDVDDSEHNADNAHEEAPNILASAPS